MMLALFITGVGLTCLVVGGWMSLLIGRHWFREGFQAGRDDRALDPGETVGSLEAAAEATEVLPVVEPVAANTDVIYPVRRVGVSTGRHARHDWPTQADLTVEDRLAIAADVHHERTADAATRYQENPDA